VGHSDIAVSRKIDPGALFPWKKLYDNGIGAWYDDDTAAKYTAEFSVNMPSIEDVAAKLDAYGYKYSGEPSSLFKAFQLHFRPEKYDGVLDVETASIAYALVEKYIG